MTQPAKGRLPQSTPWSLIAIALVIVVIETISGNWSPTGSAMLAVILTAAIVAAIQTRGSSE